MKTTLRRTLAATSVLALAIVGCETDNGTDDDLGDPVEEPADDTLEDDTLEEDTMEDDTMEDDTTEDDTLEEDVEEDA